MDWAGIEEITYSESDHPHDILGAHKAGSSILVQAYFPGAASVTILPKNGEKTYPMELADENGFFAALVPGKLPFSYEYSVTWENGEKWQGADPYSFAPLITPEDEEKFTSGIHYEIYDKLGAHPMTIDGVPGVYFAVWAPNALRVSVVGDFNRWDGRMHQMRRLDASGIFEIFLPGVETGACYKYEIKGKDRTTWLKADPYAFGQQLRPDTASVIRDISGFSWSDDAWMKERKTRQADNAPISVYELYLGSFAEADDGERYMNYRDLAPQIISYVKKMHYTHIELMPVMEHPLDGSWGYQVIGYYAPTARYGTAEDFQFFMNEMHRAGIGVILDWVPAHFPRDTYGLAKFDGTCLYEHADPRKGAHPHWGTLIYNYGRAEVANYLIANALFWVEKYHADGIRMDAVASMLYLDYGRKDGEWIPNQYGGHENLEAVEFLKHVNSITKRRNPGVLMIAEESTAWPKVTGDTKDDGLGFSLKWNMGFMNDYLSYIRNDPYFRSGSHNNLTFSMLYEYTEKFMLVFSHDEVVHGKGTLLSKMPGTREERFANLRLTLGYMITHPGKKLLFMGQDLGEEQEFSEERPLAWNLLTEEKNKQLNTMMADLNTLYTTKKALYINDAKPSGFSWIRCDDRNACMLAFVRNSDKKEEVLLVVANFANVTQKFTIGVPYEGKYKEIFNTDDAAYGGAGIVNARVIKTQEKDWDDRKFAIDMVSAPLSLCIFGYTPYTPAEKKKVEEEKAERIRQEKEAEALRLATEEAEQAAHAAAEAKMAAETAKEVAERTIKETQAAAEAAAKDAAEKEQAAKKAAAALQKLQEKQAAEKAARAAQKKSAAEKTAQKKNIKKNS